MKARLLHPKEHVSGKILPVGTIIDDPQCYWLCHMDHTFIRPLTAKTVDVVTLNGQKTAEPADEECLKRCQDEGWLPLDYVLKPDVSATPVPPVVPAVPVIATPVAPVESVPTVTDKSLPDSE